MLMLVVVYAVICSRLQNDVADDGCTVWDVFHVGLLIGGNFASGQICTLKPRELEKPKKT